MGGTRAVSAHSLLETLAMKEAEETKWKLQGAAELMRDLRVSKAAETENEAAKGQKLHRAK